MPSTPSQPALSDATEPTSAPAADDNAANELVEEVLLEELLVEEVSIDGMCGVY